MDIAFFEPWRPRALAVLRIVTAYLFMAHGTAKLFGMPYQKMFDGLQLMSLSGLAGVLEVFGGLLILIGLFTRPVAFVLSGEMAVAYFQFHFKGEWAGYHFLPIVNKGELAALYCFVFLFIACRGPGGISLDRMRGSA